MYFVYSPFRKRVQCCVAMPIVDSLAYLYRVETAFKYAQCILFLNGLLCCDMMRERARRSRSYVRLLATVQCSIPSPVPSSHPAPPCSNLTKFYFEPMTVSAVLKRPSSLDTIKALGLDGVSNRLLKECASVLAEPLTHIFNVSFEKCCFPYRWKQAVVKPLYKRKGAKNDPASYRPIALLPCVSKILEGLAREQLLSHCLSVDAIPDEQYGFLPKRSTVWQLLAVLDDWECALDTKKCIHSCFIDIAKAFDRVDHNLLLRKLADIGECGPSLSWFGCYLSGRCICTRVDDSLSSFRRISSGVPQGSVPGPLLFIIYFRDLPSVVNSCCAMFAEDTLLYDCDCNSGSVSLGMNNVGHAAV